MPVVEQLQVIEESPPPPEPPHGSRGWLLVAVAVASLLVVVLPGVEGPRAPASIQEIESEPAAPPLSLSAASREQLDTAIEVSVALVNAVNRADSGEVVALLAPTRAGAGLGSSEWPMLYGDLGWWDQKTPGSPLNISVVTDFVRYFRTLPGGLVVDECHAEAIGDDEHLIVVTCTYGAFGGMRGLMGDREQTENGEVQVIVQRGYVADVTNRSQINERTWRELRLWIANTNYERIFRVDRGGAFRPIYSGESAMQHAAVAMAFAEAIGAESLPFG